MVGAELREFVGLIESRMRCVYVAERPIDLTKLDEPNTIFVLQLPEGFSTAAGSRGGGFGERRILRVYEFVCGQGDCTKVCEREGPEITETLDLPYHAAAFPITLPDGREKLVSGVADPEFVAAYRRALT
ncbi:MAG TPA: hypothetical protein VND40_00855 [Nitrososphaerales archaeon]|nr:hypothetical protein [Nitrososphaerales archaeon]